MPTADLSKPRSEAAIIKPYRPDALEAERRLRTEPFVSVPVLAKLLSMSPDLVYRGVKDGSVPSVKVGTKVRIPSAPYRAMLPPEAPAVPQHEAA